MDRIERKLGEGGENYRCEDCPRYELCQDCEGMTVKGYYDVRKILNEWVTAKPEDVDDIDPSCFYLKRLCSKALPDQEIKCEFYYILDDCLFCT